MSLQQHPLCGLWTHWGRLAAGWAHHCGANGLAGYSPVSCFVLWRLGPAVLSIGRTVDALRWGGCAAARSEARCGSAGFGASWRYVIPDVWQTALRATRPRNKALTWCSTCRSRCTDVGVDPEDQFMEVDVPTFLVHVWKDWDIESEAVFAYDLHPRNLKWRATLADVESFQHLPVLIISLFTV